MDGAAYLGEWGAMSVISSMDTALIVSPALEISEAMPSISHWRSVAFSGLDAVG